MMAMHVAEPCLSLCLFSVRLPRYSLTGLFSETTLCNISGLPLSRVIVTNSVPISPPILETLQSSGLMIDTIDIAPVLAEAIRRIHNGESISALFGREGA